MIDEKSRSNTETLETLKELLIELKTTQEQREASIKTLQMDIDQLKALLPMALQKSKEGQVALINEVNLLFKI